MAMVMGMRAEGQSGHTEDMEHLYGIHKDGNVMQCLCLKFYDNYLSDELIKSCFIFGVSRNPYDRALSDYSWKSRGCESLEEFLLLVKDTLHTHTDEELMKLHDKYGHIKYGKWPIIAQSMGKSILSVSQRFLALKKRTSSTM
mgnify:CR=1 FL=1